MELPVKKMRRRPFKKGLAATQTSLSGALPLRPCCVSVSRMIDGGSVCVLARCCVGAGVTDRLGACVLFGRQDISLFNCSNLQSETLMAAHSIIF